MELGLKGKVALVTGGSQGLGKAICLNLAAEGVKVAINYRRDVWKVEEIIKEIREKYGAEAIAVQGDITKVEDVERIFREITDRLSGIDILVNNSGICPVSLVKDMSFEEWESVIRTNLTGTFLTSKEMVNVLIKLNKPGRIVNIVSQAAFNGSKRGKSHYSASKGGVVSLTVSLAKEVAAYGIAVNAVAPGMMYTDMTAQTIDSEIDKYKKDITIGRIAGLDEVAKPVVFLCSDAASYITGTVLDVTGGMLGR